MNEEEYAPYFCVEDGTKFFCANGVPGTIVEDEEDETSVDFIDEDGNVYVIEDSENTVVCGGNVNAPERELSSTSIKMESGTIKSLIGGSYNVTDDPETIDTVKVEIAGGKVKNVVNASAGRVRINSCEIVVDDGDLNAISAGVQSFITGYGNFNSEDVDENSDSCAVESYLTINGGEIDSAYVGSSSGYTYTQYGVAHLKGGHVGNILAASNGYTEELQYFITGGSVDILQSVNRGNVKNATFIINGGEVEKLYCGADASDSTATGTVESVKVIVHSGNVTIYPGTNNSERITAEDNIIESISYVKGTTTFSAGFEEEFADVIRVLDAPVNGKIIPTFAVGTYDSIQPAINSGKLTYPAYVYCREDHIERFVDKDLQIYEMGVSYEFDDEPTEDSKNLVSSGDIYKFVNDVVDTRLEEEIKGAMEAKY